jgi:hypothetical protein
MELAKQTPAIFYIPISILILGMFTIIGVLWKNYLTKQEEIRDLNKEALEVKAACEKLSREQLEKQIYNYTQILNGLTNLDKSTKEADSQLITQIKEMEMRIIEQIKELTNRL